MHIAALLIRSGNINFHDAASSKKRLIESLATLLATNTPENDANNIFDALFEREHLGSTGLGDGIAIPHARMPHLKHTIAAMITLPKPLDFGESDGKGVDIVFGLLVPEDDNDHHLKELSRLVSVFRQTSICQQIRDAKDADQVFDILLAVDDD
jgi:PTS system nitrogen regulatory IIA component